MSAVPLPAEYDPNTLGTPEAEDAERAVLGAVLLRDDAFEAANDALRPEHFNLPAHRYIFEAMRAIHSRGEPPGDGRLILDQLKLSGRYDDVPKGLVLDLTLGVPKGAHIPSYASRIRDKYELRVAKDWAWRLYCAAAKEQATGDVVFAEADRFLREMQAGNVRHEAMAGPALAARLGAKIEDIITNGPRRGLSTGFADIDAITTGFHPGELIVVAGRPSMGKTSWAGAMAWHVATHGGVVLFESLEMTTDDVTLRLACLDARVNFQSLREGKIGQSDINALMRSVAKLEESSIYIDDRARTVMDIRRLSRQVAAKAGKIDLVMIDYLTLMRAAPTSSGRRIDSRVREVGEMTAELKMMAKDLRIPIVVLAQLNRAVDNREEKRPKLADLRESGEIEQDADLVAFMFLEHKYNEDAPRNVGEFVISKQRNGPTERVQLSWDGPTMTYGNLGRL